MGHNAQEIIERLRGTVLSVEEADDIIAAVKARTRGKRHPADMLVEHVVQSLTHGVPAGILTDEHVTRIVNAAASRSRSNEASPGSIATERYNQRGDYPRQSEPDARIVGRVDIGTGHPDDDRGPALSYAPRKIRDNPQA